MQAEIDPYDSSVMAQLEYLPPWCPPSLFLFDEEPTVIDGYTVNKEVDARGRLIQVTLMRSHDNHVDGCVNATWENGTDRLLRVDVDKRLSHIFVYDEQGRAIKHILEGILTGKNSDEKESYTTFFQFDEQGRTVEMTEDNGRSRRLSYPDNEHSFLVILEKDAHHTFRHAINQDGNITWEIEDTGCTFDIHDLSGISWRKWK